MRIRWLFGCSFQGHSRSLGTPVVDLPLSYTSSFPVDSAEVWNTKECRWTLASMELQFHL